MLVEHSFVTTLLYSDCCAMMVSALRDAGFKVTIDCSACGEDVGRAVLSAQTNCPSCGAVITDAKAGPQKLPVLLAKSGKEMPTTNAIMELPRQVRAEFDRGRLTLAASILERGKVLPIHREVAMVLVEGIEAMLDSQDSAKFLQRWRRVCEEAAQVDTDRKQKIFYGCVVLPVVVIILIVIIAILAN